MTASTCSAIVPADIPREFVMTTGLLTISGNNIPPTPAAGLCSHRSRRRHGQLRAGNLAGKDDIDVRVHGQRLGIAAGVEERVRGKPLPQAIDVGRRNGPDLERAVDGDEDGHARYSPLRPPRFSTSRMSPMTIALSTAFTMS